MSVSIPPKIEWLGNNLLRFDGVDDYVQTGSKPDAMTAFTIEGWFKPLSMGNGDTEGITTSRAASSSGFVIRTDVAWGGASQIAGHVYAACGVTQTWFTVLNAACRLVAGEWKHLALTWADAAPTLKLYVNASLAASTVATGYSMISPCFATVIGRRDALNSASGAYFHGYIRDVAMWDEARTAACIAQDMENPPLLDEHRWHFYRLNDGSGNVANDTPATGGPDADDATIYGAAWTPGLGPNDEWTDISSDVLRAEPVHARYGIQGVGPTDLMGSTGALSFSMNNSQKNTAALLGYYTPGHANCRAGWNIGNKARLSFTYSGSTFYKMVGYLTAITPTAGIYRERRADVASVDWLDFPGTQKLLRMQVQNNVTATCAVTALVGQVNIQPRATCIMDSVQTFERAFDSDNDAKMTIGGTIAKCTRNELGQAYVRGDLDGGETFEFAGRYHRAGQATTTASLTSEMAELEVEYDRQNIWNVVRAKTYPKRIDTSACTCVFSLQQPMVLAASASQVFTAYFRDPYSAKAISASGIVYPFRSGSDFNLGSACGTGFDDLNSSACLSASIGGNSARIWVKNNSATDGYLNDFRMYGKGIYYFDPVEYESKNAQSASSYGERVLDLELEMHTYQVTGEPLAQYIRALWDQPRTLIKSVRFLANSSDAAAQAALKCEPGSRVYIEESMTGIAGYYDINSVSIETYGDKESWFIWAVTAADTTEYFRLDHSYMDIDVIAP